VEEGSEQRERRKTVGFRDVQILVGSTEQKKTSTAESLFRVRGSRSYVLLASKTNEAGSWKFRFDETEIILDHK